MVRNCLVSGMTLLLVACASVGPDFEQPIAVQTGEWSEEFRDEFLFEPQDKIEWWESFNDPVLNNLVTLAHKQNNNLRIAGLRVVEARSALAIAQGNRWPQQQALVGNATAVGGSESNANTIAGPDLQYTQYNLAASASWEIDFWGRFRRGIEAADSALLASMADYDDVLVLLAAQVADTYTVIRTTQEQLRIAKVNRDLQQRSYDIVDVQFRFGSSSELDVQQAETLLLSTEATIPGLEITLAQSRNALAVLLGLPPVDIDPLLAGGNESVPDVPQTIMVGVPADLLRQRPDVRRAEMLAMAQNAQVGVATAGLYPSFSIAGTLGVSAAGNTNTTLSGDSGFGALFNSDSLTYSIGPSFAWPFLNYGRIKNNIRVQDARLQQALIGYRETVLQAARNVQDSMVAVSGSLRQDDLLGRGVASAKRSTELSLLRYQEGFADYQRVLDAQQRLFSQEQRYISNKGFRVRSVIALYRSLGGGWQGNSANYVDDVTRTEMEQRIDWDGRLDVSPGTIRDTDQSEE